MKSGYLELRFIIVDGSFAEKKNVDVFLLEIIAIIYTRKASICLHLLAHNNTLRLTVCEGRPVILSDILIDVCPQQTVVIWRKSIIILYQMKPLFQDITTALRNGIHVPICCQTR